MFEIIEISKLKNNILKDTDSILQRLYIGPKIDSAKKQLLFHLDTLRDDLTVVVEYEYVDSIYRDEYYNFYATKFYEYRRNGIRLSFVEGGILTEGESLDYSKRNELVRGYLGFIVLRPLQACVGRNVISCRAKKEAYADISICKVKVESTVAGIKVLAEGFPHSSQDSEMMTCAETSLWSVLEYYGNKYSHYKPILSSEIVDTLKTTAIQRQLPSNGLTFNQVTRCLRNFGFSPRIYGLYKENKDCAYLSLSQGRSGRYTCPSE